jgi:hypothetical protein
MVRKALITLLLALVVAPTALATPPGQISVPASVIAAHPSGHQLNQSVQTVSTSTLVSPFAEERVTCWRAFFTGDNGGWFGDERENINPYWCGNGSVMRSLDSSWHYQNCSILVSCAGETGVGTWTGCTYGCASDGQEITGHFRVNLGYQLTVDETVIYQVYGNGQFWSYAYHN